MSIEVVFSKREIDWEKSPDCQTSGKTTLGSLQAQLKTMQRLFEVEPWKLVLFFSTYNWVPIEKSLAFFFGGGGGG